MRLLDQLARQFSAAVLSLRVTQSFDAERLLTMACMATIADCVMRVKASDVPSLCSLHYSGVAEGPVHAFGFEMRYFAVETEAALFTTPELCATRTQILDYFHQQRHALQDDHIICRFEHTMQVSHGSQVQPPVGTPHRSCKLTRARSRCSSEVLNPGWWSSSAWRWASSGTTSRTTSPGRTLYCWTRCHGLQLQSPWTTPTAAVAYSCNPHG